MHLICLPSTVLLMWAGGRMRPMDWPEPPCLGIGGGGGGQAVMY